MMIQMAVFDLDDTLLRADKTVSARTRDVLLRCRARGVRLAFATARSGRMLERLPMKLFDGYALNNGAVAYVGERPVYSRRIPQSVFVPMLQALDAQGLMVCAEVGGVHRANFDVQAKWGHIKNWAMTDFARLAGCADKLYAVVERPEQISLIQAALPDGLHMHVSKDGLAMIMHSEATKASAVRAMGAAFGIPMRDVVAFGDDANDLDMLRACGTGVAMGNALDALKLAADHVCDASEEDGVAKWLASHVLDG